MRITQLLGLLLLTGFLSGCLILHVDDPPPETFSNTALLESLIGQKPENIIRELGLPNEFLLDGDKQFMIYLAQTSRTYHTVFLSPYGPYETFEGGALYCLRIQLDSDGFVVKNPQVKTITPHPKRNCRNAFWSWSERAKLQETTDFPSAWIETVRQGGLEFLAKREEIKRKNILTFTDPLGKYKATSELEQLATKGNPYAEYTLYTRLMDSEPSTAYEWLCKSADNGHPQARYTLGQIFEYSKQGVQAYVWYSLSSYSQSGTFDEESLQSFVEKKMSTEEHQLARIELLKWRPGQCERDLDLVLLKE